MHKAEPDKMIADDVIDKVAEPTDRMNTNVSNIKETADGKKKVILCLDPKDLNNYICHEHYYNRTIDEILQLCMAGRIFLLLTPKKVISMWNKVMSAVYYVHSTLLL